MSTPVVTSRAAQKDYERIQSRHQDILSDLAQHTERVKVFNQEKALQDAAEQEAMLNKQAQQEKSQNDKTALQQKSDELEIKKMALTKPV